MLQTSPEPPPISKRELEIARAYTSGKTYREIADQLGIAPTTVRTHINNIYRKLEVSSKIELLHRIAAETPEAAPAQRRLNWRLPVLAIAALSLLAGAVMIRETPAVAPAVPLQSLAIVPFQHDGNLLVRDDLTRDLVEHLMRRAHLFVVIPSNIRLTLPPDEYADQLGRALNMRYVLSGRISSHEGGLVVSAFLYDRFLSQTIWRDEFIDGEQNIFALRLDLIENLSRRIALPERVQSQMRCLEVLEEASALGPNGRRAPNYTLQSQQMVYCQSEDIGPH